MLTLALERQVAQTIPGELDERPLPRTAVDRIRRDLSPRAANVAGVVDGSLTTAPGHVSLRRGPSEASTLAPHNGRRRGPQANRLYHRRSRAGPRDVRPGHGCARAQGPDSFQPTAAACQIRRPIAVISTLKFQEVHSPIRQASTARANQRVAESAQPDGYPGSLPAG